MIAQGFSFILTILTSSLVRNTIPTLSLGGNASTTEVKNFIDTLSHPTIDYVGIPEFKHKLSREDDPLSSCEGEDSGKSADPPSMNLVCNLHSGRFVFSHRKMALFVIPTYPAITAS